MRIVAPATQKSTLDSSQSTSAGHVCVLTRLDMARDPACELSPLTHAGVPLWFPTRHRHAERGGGGRDIPMRGINQGYISWHQVATKRHQSPGFYSPTNYTAYSIPMM